MTAAMLEKFATKPHGTRARYVGGCRCAECVQAQRAWERERVRRRIASEGDVVPSGPPIVGTDAGGRVVKRCPGANGTTCVHRERGYLAQRAGGACLFRGKPVCAACVERHTIWNGLVPADRARAHLLALRTEGVGYYAVSAASDVPASVLTRILAQEQARIRASTERAILAVDTGARADGAYVDAGETNRLLAELRAMGFTLRELGALMGQASQLAIGRQAHATARSAARVARIHRRALAGEIVPKHRRRVPAGPEWDAIGALIEQGVTARDLGRRLGFTVSRERAQKRGAMRKENLAKVRAFLAELDAMKREGVAVDETPATVVDLPRNDNGRIVGYQLGRAAAIADWQSRREQRQTKELVRDVARERRKRARKTA